MSDIFACVNMSKLRLIGFGASNMCFTDGRVAIKIGEHSDNDVKLLKIGHGLGLSPMVIASEHAVKIPQHIIDMIDHALSNPDAYGDTPWQDVSWYVSNDGCSSVLIVELVKPFMNPKKQYSPKYQARAYNLASDLAKTFNELTGLRWYDNHPWNMGKAKDGRLLIIDF